MKRPHREIATIHTDEEFRAKRLAGGIFTYRSVNNLPALKARVAKQSAFFGDLIKRANIKLN
ncbi:MAG: hypothetical protein EXR01_02045 [Acetobacteraceae bacterium]|nr:hypothetical protein [Acetobacteraceae bacterium]